MCRMIWLLESDYMCLFYDLLLVQALSALVFPSVSVIPLLSYSTFHTLIMVARRGFEHSFSRLWVWRAAVTLYVRYGVWRHGVLVGSEGFGGLGGSGGAESGARPRRIICMTICEGSEHRCCYHLLRKNGLMVGLTAWLTRNATES